MLGDFLVVYTAHRTCLLVLEEMEDELTKYIVLVDLIAQSHDLVWLVQSLYSQSLIAIVSLTESALCVCVEHIAMQ